MVTCDVVHIVVVKLREKLHLWDEFVKFIFLDESRFIERFFLENLLSLMS